MTTQTFTAKREPAVMNARETRAFVDGQKRLAAGLGFIQKHIFVNPAGNRLLSVVLHSGRLKIVPYTSFACWFNQVRTALGCALHARRAGDERMLGDAADIVELALAAPTERGLPYAACLFPEGDVFWKRGWRAFELIDRFHLPDAAATGFHLLEWHERISRDERIAARCRAMAETMMSLQAQDGSFPAWVEPAPDGWAVDESLKQSASTAAPAMFLARLGRVAPDERYSLCVKRALGFIERDVLPRDKWFDYELFYSCAGRPTGEEGPDPFTGVYPMNTLSMYWAARAALDLFEAERDPWALRLCRRILARLGLFQQAFDHPHIDIDTFGGFGVMNADGEYNDARQGLFAPLFLDAYRATGEVEYFERGVAALRASFTTMLTPEHAAVAPGNLVRYRGRDRGAILENFSHAGMGEVTSGYFSPDWGCGTALYGSGLALHDFGQVHVDPRQGHAFGIDLCEARFVSFDNGTCTIEIDAGEANEIEIVVAEGANVERLIVNRNEAEPVGGEAGRYKGVPK